MTRPIVSPKGPPDTGSPLQVLRDLEETRAARRWLIENGWSVDRLWAPRLAYLLRVRRWLRPEYLKSWDVALFSRKLTERVGLDGRVLDVGSVGSELPWVLHFAGYRDLAGCDLDPDVRLMPFARKIKYVVGDFGSLPVAPGSLAAVTAVSTLEHGVDLARFFAQASERLRPGGLLCMSTDYWPEKVHTGNVYPFGLHWTIFDKVELLRLIETAAAEGLILEGWDGRLPQVASSPISWCDRHYTFIGAVFTKAAPSWSQSMPQGRDSVPRIS